MKIFWLFLIFSSYFLHFLIFSGIFPCNFRHSLFQLQSIFSMASRYSSQVHIEHAENKNLSLPLKIDLKIFKQQSDLKTILDSKLWSTLIFQIISEIFVKQLVGSLKSWINYISWLCKKQQSPRWILKVRQWNWLILWLSFYLSGTDRGKTTQNVASEGLQ